MKTITGNFSAFRILRAAFSLALIVCGLANANAQPFAPNNTYNGWNGTTYSTIPAVTGLTFSQPARGAGLGASTAGDGLNSTGWDAASLSQAATNQDYVSFTITGNASTSFTVTGVSVGLRRSGTGPVNFQLEYSVNSAPYTALGAAWSTTTGNTSNFTQLLTGTIAVPMGGNVVFRVLGSGASSSGGTLRLLNGTFINGNAGGTPNTLTTSLVSPLSYCISSTGSASATVSYTATGAFTAGNIYTAQLSDASGSFAAPVAIGTLSSTALSGTINATIPAGTPLGSGYRIRVVASLPATTGSNNGSNLSVVQGVALSHTVSNVMCNGGADGSVTTTITEGVSPFTFVWSNSATTQDISGVSAGTYSVTVTAGNGCTTTVVNAVVSEPTAISSTATPADVLCNGGTDGGVNLSVNGGTGPYTFAWSNSTTTQNISGVAAGTYSVTITDDNGCTHTASASVSEPTAITASATTSDILCNGGTDGAVNLSVSGGTAPYTFAWSNSATTQNIANLAVGIYAVAITDNNGCTQAAFATVSEPAAITASATPVDVLCNGGSDGSVSLAVNGGTGAYTFAWSNSATTQNISGVAAGSYSVIITDNNGCTQTANASVTEPSAISAAATTTDASCNGATGTVNLSVSGGTSPYTFAWSNSATTQHLTAVAAGTYSVTITDDNGCTQTATASVTEPAVISVAVTAVDVLCNGGTNGAVNISVSGGTSPYTYAWSNSSVTQNISAVAAGTYSVTITDDHGCTQTAAGSVTEPVAITASAMPANVLCNGDASGSVNLTVSGGIAPYTFVWNNSATTQNISGVSAGSYSVTITDNNGCTQTASASVAQPAMISSSITSVPVLCNGDANGSVLLSVSGGTPSYTYLWSNSATTQNLSGVMAGTYSVTITDANGCTSVTSAAVSQAAAISSAIVSTDASCSSCADGSADLTVTGGTAPYTYAWSNSSTSEDLTGVQPGMYTVTITDANGCQWIDSVLVDFSLFTAESMAATGASVYPNPSTDGTITIRFNGDHSGAATFVLYDITGKVIFSELLTGTDAQTIQLPVSNGTYFWTITDNATPLRAERLIIAR
jgi:hypothetical protein